MADQTVAKNKQKFEAEGIVEELLPNAIFRIKLDLNGKEHEVNGFLSGKMRMNYIRIAKGDRVKVEISPYDLEKARIIYRYRD